MSELFIQKSHWNCGSYIHLKPASNDDYTITDLSIDVQSGNASLFTINENEMHVASMVLRMDGDELVVVALGGRCMNGALIQTLSKFWNDLAIKTKAKNIRAHVSKKSMGKLMERVGGQLSEYVYRKEVYHGW